MILHIEYLWALVIIINNENNQHFVVNIKVFLFLLLLLFLGPCSSAHICVGRRCAGRHRSSRWKELLPPQTRAARNHSDPELSRAELSPELPVWLQLPTPTMALNGVKLPP